MTIKQQGGIFGRNPTFNDVTIDGDLSLAGDMSLSGDLSTDSIVSTTSGTVIGTTTATAEGALKVYAPDASVIIQDNTASEGSAFASLNLGESAAGGDTSLDDHWQIAYSARNLLFTRITDGFEGVAQTQMAQLSTSGFAVGTATHSATLTVQATSSDEAGFFRPNVIDSGSAAEPTTVKVQSQKAECLDLNRYYSFGTIVQFRQNNDPVGSISVTSTTTTYNTSSDYRLKEDVQPVTGAIDRLKQLNPVNFAWKADGSRVDGFLAHEAATVVPEAVTGIKDEERDIGDVTDAEGNVVKTGVPETALPDGHTWTKTGTEPVYQGIDQSKLVPLLVAALQEAMARIEALENA